MVDKLELWAKIGDLVRVCGRCYSFLSRKKYWHSFNETLIRFLESTLLNVVYILRRDADIPGPPFLFQQFSLFA